MNTPFLSWQRPWIDTPDLIIKIIALGIFIAWQWYWIAEERKSHQEKPQTHETKQMKWRRGATFISGFFYYLQFFGLTIMPFYRTVNTQLIGLFFVAVGAAICVAARRQIGANWSHAAEYQIKKNHELVTGGIYSYIRHPIYTGLILSSIGAEMVLSSMVVLVILIFVSGLAYFQARQEEKLLLGHFGKSYADYMKRTKMFIPNIL